MEARGGFVGMEGRKGTPIMKCIFIYVAIAFTRAEECHLLGKDIDSFLLCLGVCRKDIWHPMF